jgi:hypothetical protein
MFIFNLYNGPMSNLIYTTGTPRYVYISPYVTAFFMPPLEEKDFPIEDED